MLLLLLQVPLSCPLQECVLGNRALWLMVALTVCRRSHNIQEELIYFKDSSGCMTIKGGAVTPSLGLRLRRLAGPLKVDSVVFPGSLMETERD